MPDSDSGARAAGVRRTPLYDVHAELGARFVPFAGWDMPVRYGSILDEARAVRAGVGRGRYNLVCDDDGGVIDDCIAYRRGKTRFLLVPRAIASKFGTG